MGLRRERVLIEDLGVVHHRGDEHGRVLGLGLEAVDLGLGQPAQRPAGEAVLLTGNAVVGRVRVKQRVFDVARFQFGSHRAFE